MLEWLAAIAVFALFLALLPRMMRSTKASLRKNSSTGVLVGFCLAFGMVFDPKASQSSEVTEKLQDEREDEESGDRHRL